MSIALMNYTCASLSYWFLSCVCCMPMYMYTRVLSYCLYSQITPDVPSVMDFLRRTLCFIQSQQLGINITEQAEAALQKLQDLGLISQKSKSQIDEATGKETNVQYLDTTRLGNAVFKGVTSVEFVMTWPLNGDSFSSSTGGVDLEHGSQLYADLKHGLESLILTNHLHLLYLVTPYDRISGFTPNWSVYLHQVRKSVF